MPAQGPPRAMSTHPVTRSMILAYLRRLVPIIPSGVRLASWYRDADRNEAVGGHPESQHLYALATDWSGNPQSLRQFELFAEATGMVAVNEGDHLHIQLYGHGVLASAGFPFPARV